MKMPPLPDLPVRAIEGWSEDDLRDFALEYGEMVRQECAKVCDLHNDRERETDAWLRGYNAAAQIIAKAILDNPPP